MACHQVIRPILPFGSAPLRRSIDNGRFMLACCKLGWDTTPWRPGVVCHGLPVKAAQFLHAQRRFIIPPSGLRSLSWGRTAYGAHVMETMGTIYNL